MFRALLFSTFLGGVTLALAGCSSEFKDAKQELKYLESLSNPTPEQWKRRENLREQKKEWAPEPGSEVLLPEAAVALDMFATLESWRLAVSLDKADKVSSPEWDENGKHRVTTLFRDYKVKIIEIGDDYVLVDVICKADGEPIKPVSGFDGAQDQTRGYVTKWWDRNAPKIGIVIHSNAVGKSDTKP